MKNLIYIFLATISAMFTSCVTSSYYQIYKALPASNIINKDNELYYEDDYCRVTYNFWENRGDFSFYFQNKTDSNIYLNLAESFFVRNGIANNYYKNRVFTTSSSAGYAATSGESIARQVTRVTQNNTIQSNAFNMVTTTTGISSSGYAVSYNEEKIVCIPPKTSKMFSEYSINSQLYRSCNLLRYPQRKQIKTETFTKEQSPIIFGNRLAYALGVPENYIHVTHEFYVAEITNYPEYELLESRNQTYCNQNSIIPTTLFKITAPNMFYIPYNKGQDEWRH